jgi:hypothetical protein
VDVRINKETGKASFGNIVSCHSVWACPVCAHSITEQRRVELSTAMALHAVKGGHCELMTLTFPHERHMPLKDLNKKFSEALSKFWSYRRVKNLLKAVGSIGSVRASEVTHGVNGWHPHVHVLIFVNCEEDLALHALEQCRDLWAKAVFKAGLGQINEHGFDVRGGDAAAEYVAKYGHEPKETGWTAAHELTKAPVKQARADTSRSPFDLLRDSETDDKAGMLFIEYVTAFKGKRQLYWSPGLREALGLDAEKTEAELAAEAEQQQELERETIGTLLKDQWGLVLRNNARGEVLAMAERHGWQGVMWLLDYLGGKTPTDEGSFDFLALLPMGKGRYRSIKL